MVQTITLKADSSFVVNTGINATSGDDISISIELQEKLNSISAALSSLGASEIHSEKDEFRQFEHVNIAGKISENSFGTVVSVSDFEWIMLQIDETYEAIAAAIAEEARLAAIAEEEAAAAAATEEGAVAAEQPV